MLRKDFNKIKKSVFVASLVHLSWLGRPITEHAYPPTVWAAGEAVQEQVQISAAKLQAGSYAVWMGMCAPVTQMRAAVNAGHDRLLHDAGIDAEPKLELELDQASG